MEANPWASINALGFAAIGVFLFSWITLAAIIVPAFIQRRVVPRPVMLVATCVALIGIGALFLGITFGGFSNG